VLMAADLSEDVEDVIAALSAQEPKPAIVMLISPESPARAEAVLRAGASGCLSLNVTAEELGDTLRVLHRGAVVVSSEIAAGMQIQEPQAAAPGGLSGREREVLGLVASGATNREIAQALVVTENTVKVHLRNVLDKLHLRNRQQAVAFAIREGITLPSVVVEADSGSG
jgi:DNA-binding NarL/FixJ family response regulator